MTYKNNIDKLIENIRLETIYLDTYKFRLLDTTEKYVINCTTKPLYTTNQYRLFSDKQMYEMIQK